MVFYQKRRYWVLAAIIFALAYGYLHDAYPQGVTGIWLFLLFPLAFGFIFAHQLPPAAPATQKAPQEN